jgi:hypothetical protein
MLLAGIAVTMTGAVRPALALGVEAVLAEQTRADEAAVASQQRIDEMHDETQDMLTKYRQALTDVESMKTYNEHLAVQVKSQADELGSIRQQLVEIEITGRDVIPLMQKMVDTLEKFVALDVPFLALERGKRVATLKEILPLASISISEKYRRILEAYQIEMEYGRTLEAYEGQLGEGDAARTVEFVRVGRIALMYQTLDGRETGYWDADAKAWLVDDDYASAVRAALRVAKKLGAPDLLQVPVPAPQEVKS